MQKFLKSKVGLLILTGVFMGILGLSLVFFLKEKSFKALAVGSADSDYGMTYTVSSWLDIMTLYGQTFYGIDPVMTHRSRVSLGPARWEIDGYIKDPASNFEETWYLTEADVSMKGNFYPAGGQKVFFNWGAAGGHVPSDDPEARYDNGINIMPFYSGTMTWNHIKDTVGNREYELYITKPGEEYNARDTNGINIFAQMGSYGLTAMEAAGVVGSSVDTDVDELLTVQPSAWQIYGKFK